MYVIIVLIFNTKKQVSYFEHVLPWLFDLRTDLSLHFFFSAVSLCVKVSLNAALKRWL